MNRRLFSSKVKFLFFLKFNLTKVWKKTIATIWRNPLLRESWFCEKVMLRLQGTVVERVTSCMVIVLEGCGFKATGESKRLNGDWSPLLFELVARTKLNF